MVKTTKVVAIGFGASLALACTKRIGTQNPPVFGGEGAVVAKEQPLPAESATGAAYTGACRGPAPVSDTLLFDDFEDGDNKPFKGFEREGWWWSATDTTADTKLLPAKGTFAAERLPAAAVGGHRDLVVGLDVTEQRALADRVLQSEKLAAIGTLAAGLAHEIRNPLNGAHLQLTFLERGLKRAQVTDPDTLDANANLDFQNSGSFEEENQSAYVEANASFDVWERQLRVNAGLRYTKTEHEMAGFIRIPTTPPATCATKMPLLLPAIAAISIITKMTDSTHNGMPPLSMGKMR